MTLRERIARLYAAHPRGERMRRAPAGVRDLGQTWLAREAGVSPQTVRRWVQRGEPSRYGELVLERLERELASSRRRARGWAARPAAATTADLERGGAA